RSDRDSTRAGEGRWPEGDWNENCLAAEVRLAGRPAQQRRGERDERVSLLDLKRSDGGSHEGHTAGSSRIRTPPLIRRVLGARVGEGRNRKGARRAPTEHRASPGGWNALSSSHGP